MNYETTRTINSETCIGVTFSVHRMSFGRRMELTRRVRELSHRLEFSQAGADLKDKIDAALLAAEIDRLYVEWGLVRIDGLELDDAPATPESLFESGPEQLCREAIAAVKAECGLSEEERKN